MSEELELESTPVETPEPAKGLDAIIDSAMEAQEAPEASTETITDENGRVRDRSGKFVSTKTGEEQSKDPAPEGQTEPALETQPAIKQPVEPHPMWSEADKAAFATLTPDAQKAWLESYKRQEADYTRKTQEVAEQRKSFEPVISKVQEWSPYFQQLGLQPAEAIDQLIRTEFTLRTGTQEQKQQAFAYLAQRYGVPQGEAQPTQDEWVDPQVAQLRQQVQQLTGQFSQVQQTWQQQQTQQAKADFDQFFAAKDNNGLPKYPHIQRLSEDVIELVANGKVAGWDDAYNKAVWADEEIRPQLIEAERKRTLEAEEKRRQQAVEAAKKATPVKTSPQGKGTAKPSGLDAIISNAINQHT